jgi:hypothetical protein
MAEACLVRRNFGFEPEAELTARARRFSDVSPGQYFPGQSLGLAAV